MGYPVKNRQEPVHLIQIAEIIAGIKGISLKDVADTCYTNSCKLYGWETNQLESDTDVVNNDSNSKNGSDDGDNKNNQNKDGKGLA